jgi:cellulose synthase/poly-beta-1,6-N-acetylglucosamine synthase-like glycosyltransferase
VSERPAVDVVLPFYGSDEQLERVAERLAALELRRGDSVTIADNRPAAAGAQRGSVAVIPAGELRTSYHARNAAAARGHAEWLVFLDADVVPPADLLDRYFAAPTEDDVGILAGTVIDGSPGDGEISTSAERYAWLKSSMSQEITLASDEWAFAQTANAAVRRVAFEQVGGFEEGVRSGGDADLCFRVRAAGWKLERREDAAVVHRNRSTVPRMLAQRARHGAGAAWVCKRWPGALPRRRWPGLAWWSLRRTGHGLYAALRGDTDEALLGLLDGPTVWAFELGRLIPNRPRPSLRKMARLPQPAQRR